MTLQKGMGRAKERAFQVRTVRAYAARWGVSVVEYDPQAPPSFKGGSFFDASFPASSSSFASGVIDVAENRVYWPDDGDDAYGLLHELTHALFVFVYRSPPTYHDEFGSFAAFEWASVKHLAPSLSLRSWSKWRRQSGGTYDEEVALLARKSASTLKALGLFAQVGEKLVPTYRMLDLSAKDIRVPAQRTRAEAT